MCVTSRALPLVVLVCAASAQPVGPGIGASEPSLTGDAVGHAVADPLAERTHLLGDAAGLRSHAQRMGIGFEAGLIVDSSVILDGGADEQAGAIRHVFNADLTIDTGPLLGWGGGKLFASFVTQHGEDGSEEAGDFQAFSNIDGPGFTALYELWYQQTFTDDRLRLKIGKIDANGDFAYVEHGGEFIHSSVGFSPTILSFPSYPDPATGVVLFVYERGVEASGMYAGAGLFDGALQEGVSTGTRGPSTFLGSPADLFLIGQAGVRWGLTAGLPGRLGVGAWHHTGSFERFDGDQEHGSTGFYFVLDQTVWRPDPEPRDESRGIGLFLQYGYADPDVSEADHHAGAGVAWTEPIPGRRDDVTGIMVSYVHFSGDAGFDDDFELALEWFYKISITPWFSLKPDLQYIVNPGGEGDLDDALVGTLRLELAF